MTIKLKLLMVSLLVAVCAPAFAQVTLGDGTTKTWAEYVNIMNDPTQLKGEVSESSQVYQEWKTADEALNGNGLAEGAEGYIAGSIKLAAAAKEAYQTASDNVQAWNARLTLLNSDKTPVDWLNDANTAAKAFNKAFLEHLEGGSYTDQNIWYKYGTIGSLTKMLTISFTDPGEETYPGTDNKTYSKATVSQFSDYLSAMSLTDTSDANYLRGIRVYFGKDEKGNYNYTGTTTGLLTVTKPSDFIDITQACVDAISKLVSDPAYDKNAAEIAQLKADIAEYTTKDANGKTKLNYLSEAATQAQATMEADQKTLAAKEAALEKAEAAAATTAFQIYRNVTLTADVTATAENGYVIKDFDKDSRIIGGKHVITVTGGSLFDTMAGKLSNLAVNGKLCDSHASTAALNTVAVWNGDESEYYNAKGVETAYTDLGALGYAARATFGVDFDNSVLVGLTNATKVYSITTYNSPTENHQYFVQTNGTEFTKGSADNSAYNAPSTNPNMFIQCADNDLKTLSGFDMANVFFTDGTSPKVVITDGNQFYCPQAITAATMNYTRTFKAGQNAVCLPFELDMDKLNAATGNAINAICTFDQKDDKKFWFTSIGQSIPANTPALIIANKEVSFTLSDMLLSQTPASQKVTGNNAGECTSYGLFKAFTSDEVAGVTAAYKVFGLTTNKTTGEQEFQPAKQGAKFPAMRMVIYWSGAPELNQAPMRIAIRDERGVDITDKVTTGINNVTEEAASFSVAGGVGEITITSGEDRGNVAIYSVDGKVAANANVAAGVTTVNVKSGLYIVMGKKVIVK